MAGGAPGVAGSVGGIAAAVAQLAAVARRRLREIRRGRGKAAVADQEDLRGQSRAQLGDDPARHAIRRGRHHRPRGVPRADEQGERKSRHQDHDARVPDPRVGRGAAQVPGFQRVAGRGQPGPQEIFPHRLRRGHAERTGRARHQERRPEGRAADREGDGRTVREGARRQAGPGRHAGRLLLDQLARRHRRHRVHAHHQRAGSRDPRRVEKRDASPFGTGRISRRASWCRCRSPTTIA